MNTALKIGAFASVLAATLAVSYGVGAAVGPVEPAGTEIGADMTTAAHAPVDGVESGREVPGGLQVAEDGFALVLRESILPAGRAEVAFTVIGPQGLAVTAFEPTHGKALHLIAVTRDLGDFRHVHPQMTADGTWRTTLDLRPGAWRLFADFAPAGRSEPLTLGVDAFVDGQFQARPLGPTTRTARVDDYEVALSGDLTPGVPSTLTMSVTRAGQPVRDLQPYLEAFGHLVALRAGDLAYLHVHPVGEPGDGVTAPGAAAGLRRDRALGGSLPAVPGLPAPRSGADGGVHARRRAGHDTHRRRSWQRPLTRAPRTTRTGRSNWPSAG